MFGFPKSTEFNKRIPKQKFYENLTVSTSLKKAFIEQIKTIYWRNKIATSTLNLAEGTAVDEIEVFEIKLNGEQFDEAILRQMDKEIPYHILFIMEYEDKYQAWIGYKEEAQSGSNAFTVSKYYHTDWAAERELPIKVEGLSIDAVYENFVRQIAGEILSGGRANESLKESVDREQEISAIKKEIQKLKRQIKKEKQLNVQIELNNQVKNYIKRLDEYG